MKGYQPTPDDLALEQLLDEACERFRHGQTAKEKHQALVDYRELLGQRSPEFQRSLDQKRAVINDALTGTNLMANKGPEYWTEMAVSSVLDTHQTTARMS